MTTAKSTSKSMLKSFSTYFLIPIAIAIYLSSGTVKLILFSVTDGLYGNWPDIQLNCGKADFDAFFKRLVPTPTYKVNSFEECFEVGEKMKHPLICQLNSEISKPEAVLEAIKKDNTTYDLICRDKGDFHWCRPSEKKPGTILSVIEKPSWCGAGFIYGKEHQEIMAHVIPGLNETFNEEEMVATLKGKNKEKMTNVEAELHFTTSFVSNYPEPAISTGTHAAMIISLAFQLAGQKIWIMHNREESNSEYYFRTSWRTFPNCLSDWLVSLKKPWIATTNPGDVLYFPMAYEHFVYSDKGVNLMTNIRKAFKPSPQYVRDWFGFLSIVKIFADSVLIKGMNRGNPRDAARELGLKTVLNKVVDSTSSEEVSQIKAFGQRLYNTYH
jgi:hypothetical protein